MTIYSFLLLSSLTTAYAGNLQRHRLQKSIVPSAINHNGDECSCSNTKFTFRLDFSQDCTVDNIQENAGIDSTYCIIDNANTAEEPVRKLQSTTPVEITSVEFLEFARGSMEVMYRDDSYMNARLVDGDTVTFYSSSSYLPVVSTDEQDEYIPGGVSLIITGMTEDGNEVRNRFYWLYDEVVTDCLENLFLPGIYEGDAIGWVVVVSSQCLCLLMRNISFASYLQLLQLYIGRSIWTMASILPSCIRNLAYHHSSYFHAYRITCVFFKIQQGCPVLEVKQKQCY